ncbi:mycofactocin biosynthesis chaperone MftB [Rhodococcus sp. X156]|uniref:mycofactocin biosynthesis chaperone MftB n=1 Tax=Rhodococcus sp. X156 TaxID=2499145 RepID=UPI000FD9D388|nr:mycofactocin biosynthesis chaperone MftB [Rhodococcus sp. X156]
MPVLEAEQQTAVLDGAWQVHPKVAVRPEPFGALLYHFGTRRLSFLKNHTVVGIVQSLANHPDARSACLAAGVGEAALPSYAAALATLVESTMIIRRDAA